ncbi:putative membrane protein [Cytobacillus horneckiae]|uniref:type VII secretion protein EsaA n=1 Tax=Cytobacillus horneckiae TaxID=549687 RepID=UPI0019D04341|nr:type VII secretion protein EsaA [Cytobacillus horneckiae]MBN6889557.1 type VII secretion protein EsaA [Cytobacillus horneckiae]
MTEKVKYIIKMIIVMVLVLATPAVFFSSIGDNPLLVRTSETRNIAIVNEDIGAEKDEKELEFGQEIASVLSSDSSFDWTVLSRSAAVNGLKNKNFDAVVYIPSDFSTNIMTYEDLTPVKAEFRYTVQDQLNAVNREKVLREIEKATARVNSSVSTLYWSYVSQDLESVRSKFDGILEKEIDFQNTMYAFYSPSSQNLANEIEQQKTMLESIQSSLKSNEEFTVSNTENVKQFEQSLSSFVEYVEQYKEYQDNQQELLQQLQQESMAVVNDAISQQNPRYMELRAYLREQSDELSKSMGALGTHLAQNNQTMAELSAVRIEQVARQRDDLVQYRRDAEEEELSKYIITSIPQLKDKLANGSVEQPEVPEEPIEEDPQDGNEPNPEKPGEGGGEEQPGPSLEEERQKLSAIVTEVNGVHQSLTQINDPEIEEITSAIAVLTDLTAQMNAINENLRVIQEEENPLQGTVEELQKQVAELQQQVIDLQERIQTLTEQFKEKYLDLFRNRLKPVMDEIEKKEEQILQSHLLGPNQRDALSKVFEKEIVNKQPELIMSYHSALIKFETAIANSLRDGQNLQAYVASLNPILGIKEDEQSILDKLLLDMPEANKKLTTLQEETTVFFEDHSRKMQEQQATVGEELGVIQESADAVMQKMVSIIGEAPVQGGESQNGGMLVTNQQSISDGLVTMNDAINHIGESQTNVVTYTDELQTKVQSVQQDADHLNEKWSDNVATTEMYRDDIFSVLGNTFVDGQKNGHVYNHLASPLQVNGQVAAQQEEKKVPPVVVLVIVLISSLMIGYFSYYFSNSSKLVKGAMFILLNLVVGLIISMYGMDIYPLGEQSAIQWTVFTILLLAAASAVVSVGFSLGRLIGWFASVGLVLFFISPLLALTAPNIGYEDPMSKVYMSIQYGPDTLFIPAVITLLAIILVLALIPFGVNYIKNRSAQNDDEETYEAS